MERGDEFLAKLRLQDRMTLVLYRVCNCDSIDGRRFRIGANLVEFVGTPADILQSLLAQDEQTTTPPDQQP